MQYSKMVRCVAYVLAIVLIPALSGGCNTTGGSGSSKGKRGKAFLHVFVDDEAKSMGPTDVQVLIDDKLAISRNFIQGRNTNDGKYLLNLLQGKHQLTAVSQGGKTHIKRTFTIKGDDVFIDLYLTDQGKFKLTPKSKLSVARFVCKKMSKPREKQFHPALWTRMTERDFTKVKEAR